MLQLALVFALTFCIMEFNAWFLHRYVMHGFLWVLHEDHHRPRPGYRFQRNDAFAIFFAVPSFFSILLNALYGWSYVGAVGYGIMAYGIAYFFVHEVIIHRRLKVPPFHHWYFRALIKAHTGHHAVTEKEGCYNFGMFCVPLRYFKEARAAAKAKEKKRVKQV